MVEGVSGGIVYHPIPSLQKLFAHRPKKAAAAGQGRNEHWIVATIPPQRVSAKAPPPERSLRVQDLSRGATPRRTTKIPLSTNLSPNQPFASRPTNIPTPKQQRDRAETSIGS
jgi:hypothetical protein